MATVNGEPDFTQLDKLNIITRLLVRGRLYPTQSSLFFTSITDRDAYFTDDPTLLVNGLIVPVNINNVINWFYWSGADNPTTYDPDLWVGASINSTPGTLFLGQDGARLSSGAAIVNFTDAYGNTYLPAGTFFTEDGSRSPGSFEFQALQTLPVTDVFDTQLSAPQDFLFPPALTTYTIAFIVRPAEAGTLTIMAYAGSTENDPPVLDLRVDITAGQVGSEVTISLPNGLLAVPGTQQYVVFGGIDLFGGLQTSGGFIGQIKPFLSAQVQFIEQRKLIDNSDINDYVELNKEYLTTSAITGGLAVVTLPSATTDTFNDVTFVPGVAATSNPTLTTVGTAIFSAGDIISIVATTGFPDANTGLYEVLSHASNTLTVRGVGTTATVETFTKDQFLSQTSTGTIAKVQVSVLRANGSNWEVAVGDATPFSYSTIGGGGGGGDVMGPASSVDNHVATFDGTTGKVIQQTGQAIVRSENSVSLAEYVLQDHLGTNVLIIEHFDSLATNAIRSTEPLTVEVTGAGDSLTLESDLAAVNTTSATQQTLTVNSAASTPGWNFVQTGTNGGDVELVAIDSSPEGVTTAPPGSLALSESGAVYVKETGVGNTGWALLDSGGSFELTNTPVDAAMIIADGTSGTQGEAFNNIRATVVGGIQNRLSIDSGASSGGLFINNDSTVLKGALFYTDSTDRLALTTESGVDLGVSPQGSMTMTAGAEAFYGNLQGGVTIASSDGQITFSSNKIQTLLPGFIFENTIASGTDIGFSVQTNVPEGFNNGTPGDLVIRSALTDSDIYLKRNNSEVLGTNGWDGVFETIDNAVSVSTTVASMRRNTDSALSQSVAVSAGWTRLQGFDSTGPSASSGLTANTTDNIIEIDQITDTSNGDLYYITAIMSVSALTNTDIDYRIEVNNGAAIVGSSNILRLRELHNDGSNFFNSVTLSGYVRGPTSNPSGTPYFAIQFQRTTGTTAYTHFVRSVTLSARRVI